MTSTFLGDFSSFIILTKSGNPCPQDHTFIEPTSNKDDIWSTPKSKFGSLRRSISRQSLRYRSGTLTRSSAKFSSVFSLRSTRDSRRNLRAEADNSRNKSSDSIDKIDEESGSRKNSSDVSHEMRFVTSKIDSYTRNSSFECSNGNESSIDAELHSSTPSMLTSTPIKRKNNPFDASDPWVVNGVRETHFVWRETGDGEFVSKEILDEVLDIMFVPPDPIKADDDTRYDDRKNPFMDEVYDDSLGGMDI